MKAPKAMKRLSDAQLAALDLACRYRLWRGSAGWMSVDRHGHELHASGRCYAWDYRMHPSDPVLIIRLATVASLYRMGLIEGELHPPIPVTAPSLVANERGRAVLAQLDRDAEPKHGAV